MTTQALQAMLHAGINRHNYLQNLIASWPNPLPDCEKELGLLKEAIHAVRLQLGLTPLYSRIVCNNTLNARLADHQALHVQIRKDLTPRKPMVRAGQRSKYTHLDNQTIFEAIEKKITEQPWHGLYSRH